MYLHPLKLKGEVFDRMTEEEFFCFCQDNKDMRIERNHLHEILVMSPTGSLSGIFNGEIFRQLANWNAINKKGYAFDSSTGFTLPDKAVFSPDASWASAEKWEKLTQEEKLRFAPICPEFIIELKSPSDDVEVLKKKMLKWSENGVLLGLLVNPEGKETYLYAADGSIDVVKGFENKVDCGSVLEGLGLDLSFIKL
jgi:Uma2 family endonuclease